MLDINELKFDERGLIPTIAQDYETKEVLMLAYMNAFSIEKTINEGRMCYYSRSRNAVWVKGETSGHYQTVIAAKYDCDNDALLFLVKQEGVACHTGERSCFYRELTDTANHQTASQPSAGWPDADSAILSELIRTIKDRRDNPVESSYTNYLLEKGLDKILKKVGEEASEVIIAAKNLNNDEITCETADLIYHVSVLLVNAGLTWNNVFGELSKRHK